MSYVQRVLQPGETVLYKSSIHWLVYIPGLFLVLVGLGGGFYGLQNGMTPLASLIAAVGLAFGLVSLLSAWFRRWTTEIAVTERRIIFKEGFIRRRTIEMNMDKVESVDVNQSIMGRVLNYGNIIVRGTGAGLEPLRMIEAPIEFRNKVIAR